MSSIHSRLMRKKGAYAKWHNQPHSHYVHWLVLITVGVGIASFLAGQANQIQSTVYAVNSSNQSKTAPPPATYSGTSFIDGFETGTMNEGVARGGTIESSIVRSGNYAYEANPVNSNQFIAFDSQSSDGTLRPIFRSTRFYIRIGSLPVQGSVAIAKIGGAVTLNPELDLNSNGTLTLADSWTPAIVTSNNALSADGLWHRVEFDVGVGLKAYVDGNLWIAANGENSYPAGYSMLFGAGESERYINATADLYFDDILVSASPFSQTGLPGDGHDILLKPKADPAALNSWTAGGGSTSNLWSALSNLPPAGLSADAATNNSQIKNTSSGNNQDYKLTTQSYAEAGIPAGSTINAVMAISNDGVGSLKGSAKIGGLWIDQNPTQPAGGYAFIFGDGNSAIGSFPFGWASHYGPVTPNPVVNLSSSPVVALRKSSGNGVDADVLGIYVDYK